MPPNASARIVCPLVLCLALVSCTPRFAVERSNPAEWFAVNTRCVVDGKGPSEPTMRYLRLAGLEDLWDEELEPTLDRLDEVLAETSSRQIAFAAAEVAYSHGECCDDLDRVRVYITAARYAWAYLYDDSLVPAPSGYDPKFRWALDVYNRSLAEVMEWTTRTGYLRDGAKSFPSRWGDIRLVEGEVDLDWDPATYERFLLSYDYRVVGIQLTRQAGIGVPMIAVRVPPESERQSTEERFLPDVRQAYANTLVLRFQGPLRETGPGQRAFIEIIDPIRSSTIDIGGEPVPIEIDLTTPLAHMLAELPDHSGLSGLIYSASLTEQNRLLMLQPYRPGRIPVVFVHGLMSSPLTWMPLFNELLADPLLRERYQFWFFSYATGNPVLFSARTLREALQSVSRVYDPEGTDPHFQAMVVCGHSMGGLLTRTLLHDSGTRIWDAAAEQPFDEVDIPEDLRSVLREVIFFERQPFVSRAVFMASPHRGADLAEGFIGWLGRKLTSVPSYLARPYTTLRAGIQSGVYKVKLRQANVDSDLTGISSLSPGNIALSTIASWPLPDDIPVHSIIGDQEAAGRTGGSDGVVPYSSSHLDGVESELVVESGHSVQESPVAIAELVRILHEHLRDFDERSSDEAVSTDSRAGGS